MSRQIIKISALIAVFITSTSIAIGLALFISDSFTNKSIQEQGSIFALSVIPLYLIMGIGSVWLINKPLNKKLGIIDQPYNAGAKKKIFELHQKIALMVNEYRVLEDTPEGSQKLIASAKQKRLAIREKFTLYADESQQKVLSSSKARSIIDLGAVYDIFNEHGEPIAAVKKEFKRSLLRSTWGIYGPNYSILKFSLREKNQYIAIIRRLWELFTDIPFPIKYHFEIIDVNTNRVVGDYIKITRLRDRYALYLEEGFENKIEKSVWIVTAVLMDAMQSR